jgi:hypothetical protein
VIGVYERLVSVVAERLARVTSRAAEPQITSGPGAVYHLACYEARKTR